MNIKKISSKTEIKNSDKAEIYLIDADEKTIRSILASLKQKKISRKIAVLGRDDNFNRRMIEKTEVNFLVSPERGTKTDTLKQRDSGLNHYLAKEAKKKNIVIVIDFDEIKDISNKKQRAIRLGRVMQNIQICRKAGCKLIIWGKADKRELTAFGLSLGMSSQQAKEVGDNL